MKQLEMDEENKPHGNCHKTIVKKNKSLVEKTDYIPWEELMEMQIMNRYVPPSNPPTIRYIQIMPSKL